MRSVVCTLRIVFVAFGNQDAWAQVTTILAMNNRLKFGRFAMETANTMQAAFFAKLSPATLLAVARPVTRCLYIPNDAHAVYVFDVYHHDP